MTVIDLRRGPAGPASSDDGEWVIESVCRRGGLTEVHRVGDQLHLRVGDAPGTADSCTEAWLHTDGRVAVSCPAAPAALMVTAGGSRLVPAVPGRIGDGVLCDGDLLVMCSAGALDHLPAGIGAVLAWAPRQIGSQEPEVLLDRLMSDSEDGAALLACYRSPASRAATTDRANRLTEEDR